MIDWKDRELVTKVITVRIFDNSDQIYQDVFAYLTEFEPETWEAIIKMPVMVQPSDIHADVHAAMCDEIEGSFYLAHVNYTVNHQLV